MPATRPTTLQQRQKVMQLAQAGLSSSDCASRRRVRVDGGQVGAADTRG
jgi:hypothetical protein